MASEIRVDKINSLSGVGTVTLSPTGVDIAGITTAATLKATTGIVTTLTATTGIVTTFEATTGDITTLRTPTGIATHFTADKISLPDSTDGSLCIGIGSDLKLNHNGTNSYIDNITGDFYIRGVDEKYLYIQAKSGENSIVCKDDGAVELYYDNSKKLETMSSGAYVEGYLNFPDNGGLRIGSGNDLKIFHNGTRSKIENLTGELRICGNTIQIKNYDDDETFITATDDGAVELYHNNTKMAETITNGFEVFGNFIAENDGAGSGTSEIQLQPYGTDAYINCTASGNLYTRMGTGYDIRTQIDGSGNFIVQSGNLKLATAGKGIDFSATSGTGSSELLDDYEEGTWLPTLTYSGGGGATLSEQLGHYTKIGRMVNIILTLTCSAQGGGSGNVLINGLPFQSGSTSGFRTNGFMTYATGFNGINSIPVLYKGGAGTNMELLQTGGTGTFNNIVNITRNNITSSTTIRANITYYVD